MNSLIIKIPSDNDGYILQECPICGERFKIKSDDVESTKIYCPMCGMHSKNFLPGDIIKVMEDKAENLVINEMNNFFDNIDKHLRGIVEVKGKFKNVHEKRLSSKIDTMIVTKFECCTKSAKIKPMLRMTGCYCPYCGMKEFEL